jgi:RNA recognition motif-containing protein
MITKVRQPAGSVAAGSLTRDAEICEDVQDECSKFGKVVELKVPRPTGGSRQSAGVGKIFVKFDSVESATKALTALAGRKFADRTVVSTYFPEVRYFHSIIFYAREKRKANISTGKLRGRRLVIEPAVIYGQGSSQFNWYLAVAYEGHICVHVKSMIALVKGRSVADLMIKRTSGDPNQEREDENIRKTGRRL